MVSYLTMVASLAMVASLVSITVACHISDHGRISRLRPWSRLRLGAFAFTLIAFGFSIFFSFTVLLESGFN